MMYLESVCVVLSMTHLNLKFYFWQQQQKEIKYQKTKKKNTHTPHKW